MKAAEDERKVRRVDEGKREFEASQPAIILIQFHSERSLGSNFPVELIQDVSRRCQQSLGATIKT